VWDVGALWALEGESTLDAGELKEALHLTGPPAQNQAMSVGLGKSTCADDRREPGAIHEGNATQIDQHSRDLGRVDTVKLTIKFGRRLEIELSLQGENAALGVVGEPGTEADR
jgi:hypothetical protein